ncbi:MAG: glycine--tRNA ligase subunit beta [Thermoleophilia bacterium]|nr:glycine--tRNA ligase subunit beta [Thermoleophilia bacterium]
MSDLLIEIGCEELPASACREAIAQVPDLARKALAAARLPEGDPRVWVAPRRIAVMVEGLPDTREGRSVEARGPAEKAAFDSDGNPTKAAQGFARSHGLTADGLTVEEVDGRRFVFARREEPAADTASLVPGIAAAIVNGLRFGKNMRWGDGTGLRFSRPVRWIVATFGGRPVEFEIHGLAAGATSQGHRFLGHPVEIGEASGYRDALRGASVIADHDERRRVITEGLDAAAAADGAAWEDPLRKLEEVVHLVEAPSVIVGDILPEHLRLPEDVLVTAMQSHQRYFPLRRSDGSLAPRFLAVSNGDPAHNDTIARGNAGVLDARLQDASFSWDRDREAGLAALDDRLDAIVFHAKLGSMADKRDRLAAGAEAIARAAGLTDAQVAQARRAGELAKVDQGAVLVAEFSDLQGYVGARYAEAEGEDPVVAGAVQDHYLPEGPDSPLPGSDVGVAVALAERIDNLTGLFLAGDVPTSSKDPYALRRAAAGVVRMLTDRGWRVPLHDRFEATADALAAQGADIAADRAAVFAQLDAFVADRVAYQLRGEGVGAEPVAAAVGAGFDDVTRTAAWARALAEAVPSEPFQKAWTASIRLERIGAKAAAEAAEADASNPEGDGERRLAEATRAALDPVDEARHEGDVAAAMAALGPLADAVDGFFDDVLVNDEDPHVRARRYALIREAAEVFGRVARFSAVTAQAEAGK